MAALTRLDVAKDAQVSLDLAGSGSPFAAASGGGDTIALDDATDLYILNNDGSTGITATLAAQVSTIRPGDGRFGDIAVAAKTVTVAKGKCIALRAPACLYSDENGLAHLTYSGVTNVHVAAVRRV